jgi:hypothetical protein
MIHHAMVESSVQTHEPSFESNPALVKQSMNNQIQGQIVPFERRSSFHAQ